MNGIHNPAALPSPPDCTTFTEALEQVFAFAVTVEHYMQAGIAARGLTRARATVIWQLHRHGPTTQQQLARAIGVTARNVTALVDGLQDSGFVRREPHPSDRRAFLVHLTDTGRQVTKQLAADYEAGSQDLFSDIPVEQMGPFLSTMQTLTARLATATGPQTQS
ncbi:MarR family transcriptional regulator [Micromonospora sp. NPDC005367]|uniref:MarR family winged helix-turn-helix transcriptional regulator n=1 Tax=Micromonospora sp. NPDC005367 TaxID=3155590 RepID=UPI0033A7F53B